MKQVKNRGSAAALAATSLLVLSVGAANISAASELLTVRALGSGQEVRSHLSGKSCKSGSEPAPEPTKGGEGKCGEGKCGDND